MRIDQLDALPPAPHHGLRLRTLHGVEHGGDQIQGHHHHHSRQRIGSLQLPGDSVSLPLDLLRTLLRVHAIGFHVLVEGNIPQRVGVRISVRKMRASPRSGSINSTCAPISKGRPDGFGERIAGLDGDVDGLVVIGVGVEDRRNLRKAADRPRIRFLKRRRQFYRDRPAGDRAKSPRGTRCCLGLL
jgi:hypothetical protein